ncbi:MAG: hypothetical protein OJF59_001595 [Cytophagales bacterium]|jgi:3-methyladenine DNA glycosylase AlkD|nr:DNA alkylation repair protein [Bacteroidota bacterium]MBS1980524.1 DNA alkylation repair protein [Bacteroidota bacterium]WHZ07842.1 MAG: hypothetical protein OJF59_001595 [Cytophagales bacterium]
MPVSRLHQDLLAAIINNSGTPTQHTYLNSYLGNTNPRYAISIPKLRNVGKAWLVKQPISEKEFIGLLTALVRANSSTEKMMAGLLLDYGKKLRGKFNPTCYNQWLNHAEGWAEVDALCYGHFKTEEILARWNDWKKILVALNRSKNINKRRASLVLLCQPLAQGREEKLMPFAFSLVRSLQHEREILITKAVSWILRSMVKYYRKEVSEFVKNNKTTLPALAVRETLTKIKTGRKN